MQLNRQPTLLKIICRLEAYEQLINHMERPRIRRQYQRYCKKEQGKAWKA